MSRIGKKPVIIPEGVEVAIQDGMMTVKGKNGELSRTLHKSVTVSVEETETGKVANVTIDENEPNQALWGTVRSHLDNMVAGVTEGWKKSLELSGVGFKINLQGKKLVMSLGFSHDVNYELPEGVEATVEGMVINLSSANKDLVGQTAAEIRSLKKPEPYKGKGFRYSDETIRRKAGKAAKSD